MATTMYMTADAPDYVNGSAPDSAVWRKLSDTMPSSLELVTNTLAGPVDQFDPDALLTESAGGAKLCWVSPPVDAFTMNSTHYIGVSAKESNAAANVARFSYRVGRLSGGTLTWNCGGISSGSELPTSQSAYSNSGAAVNPDPNPEFASGDQIVVECFLDDAGGDMASGYTASYYLSSMRLVLNNNVTFQAWPSAAATPMTPMRGIW